MLRSDLLRPRPGVVFVAGTGELGFLGVELFFVGVEDLAGVEGLEFEPVGLELDDELLAGSGAFCGVEFLEPLDC